MGPMDWLMQNWQNIAVILLVASEAGAAISQLAFPNNKGLSGALQTVISVLQKFGVKRP